MSAKTVKTKIIKAFDGAYSLFPPDRALHLAQAVFAGICDASQDAATMTLNDIAKELADLVVAEKVSFEDIVADIDVSAIDGRLSGTLIDTTVAAESIHRRRQLEDYRLAQEAEAVAAAADAKELQKKARKTKAKTVLCNSCGAEPGFCDCAATQLAKLKKKDAAEKKVQKASCQVPVLEVSDSSSSEEDEEVVDDSDDGKSVTTTTTTGRSKKKLDLDNPGIVLDPSKWPRLATTYTSSDLQQAIKVMYLGVFDTYRHDATFIASCWLQFSAVLAQSPNTDAIEEAVSGIRVCRARFEYMLGKKHGVVHASTVENELNDQKLPKDIRKARHAGRTAEKRDAKDQAAKGAKASDKPDPKKPK